MSEINIKRIIDDIRSGDFVINCNMPMGYSAGYPTLKIQNNQLCLLIPFLRYKITGEPDKTLVFPIRFVVTVALPNLRIVGFDDLSVHPAFKKVNFNRPIGLFRHESVKRFSKKEYFAKKDELFSLYDKMASAILYGDTFTSNDDEAFIRLINIMLEPSLRPIYKAIDPEFYNNYLNIQEENND